MFVPCLLRSAVIAAGLLLSVAAAVRAQGEPKEDLRGEVEAPPNMRELSSTLGGGFFVDKELLDRYDALKAHLAQIREEITRGTTDVEAAMTSLSAIEEEAKELRAEIEKKKVVVSAFKAYSKTTEETFPLGDERLVIITGDNVTVRGWEGPGVKCVVEKIILAKQQPAESEFDSIAVKHALKVDEEKVGQTQEKRDQGEQEFMNSEAGRKLADEQKANRKRFVEQIHNSYDDYLAFQGREANTIQLDGLTYQEGNRNLTLQMTSPGGGGSVSSQWQRHAKLTVYVPPCKSLAVRGCQQALDVQSIECDLVLTTHDSRERDYEGAFSVRGVKGNVTISQVPVRSLSEVSGNVRFVATNEFVNSGTRHYDNLRTFSVYETHATRIDHVGGNLDATFLRTDLKLSAIQGVINVINEHGTSDLKIDHVDAEHAQRIVSQSGQIRVEGSANVLTKMPIYAYTQCGRLLTNISREVLDDAAFDTGVPKRGWNGFVTPSKERFDPGIYERPTAIMEDGKRAAGLDLISHAGMVSILTTDGE